MTSLRSLYPVEQPVWCGRLEAAGVFEANLLGVKELWWGVGLGAPEFSGGGSAPRAAVLPLSGTHLLSGERIPTHSL